MRSISSSIICDEAKRQGFSVSIIDEGSNRFFVKKGRQKILFKNIDCGLSTTMAAKLATFKHITYFMLIQSKIQTQSFIVLQKHQTSDALSKLKDKNLSYPLVVKPSSGARGNAVTVNIKDDTTLLYAIKLAKKNYDSIIIEEFLEGQDYRIMVVDYKFIAAIKRVPPFVVGDGKKTIKQLIQEINKDPIRKQGHESALSHIKIDASLRKHIETQHFSLDTVLAKKKKIFVRKNANLSTGGLSVDVTDMVHSSIKSSCEKAAKILGLKVCGVDVIIKDISKSLDSQKGGIIEVNCTPSLRGHHFPAEGKPRNVAKKILELAVKTLWKK